MNYDDSFDSKQSQYTGDIGMVYGVNVLSRYNRVNELLQILNFLQKCKESGVVHYIERVFYDSQACLCEIELLSIVKTKDAVWSKIFNIAHTTISQFEFPGWQFVCHSDEVYFREFIRDNFLN